MKLYVIRDSNFTLRDGVPSSNLLDYGAYASRYLQVFDEVVVVGRLSRREDVTALPVTGAGVEFLALPSYQGPWGFVKSVGGIFKTLLGSVDRRASYILRIPATIPSLYALVLWMKRIPFAVEVAADPYDGYSKRSLDGARLAFLWRWLFVALVRWQCRRACATAYVTSNALQRRYPPGRPDATFAFTSLNLGDECYRSEFGPTREVASEESLHIVMTGNMQKSLKGHDTLLHALNSLVRQGIDAKLTIVGFGESQRKFEDLSAALGLADRVRFTGKLPAGAAVREVLDSGDLFVLPSRQEGLPRAMLEAMARGLPAVATDVGGTSELLPAHALIQPDDFEGLARKIKAYLTDPSLRRRDGERNLAVSRAYHVSKVNSARLAFFRAVKASTQIVGSSS